MPPCSCASARRQMRVTASSMRSPAGRPTWRVSTGKARPSLASTGASPRRRRDARAVERRRHDDEAQILAQPRLRVERERETEIGIERALVEFVEDHGRDIGERWILEDEAREHALGHDLETGVARDARTEPHAKPDSFADILAEPCRHAARRGARREPARLEEKNAPALVPRARREAQAARASSCRRRSARRSRHSGRRRNAARISGRRSSIGSGVSSMSRMAMRSAARSVSLRSRSAPLRSSRRRRGPSTFRPLPESLNSGICGNERR